MDPRLVKAAMRSISDAWHAFTHLNIKIMTSVGPCAAQDDVADTHQQADLLTSRLQSKTDLLVQARSNSSHSLIFGLAILSMLCAAQDNVADTRQQVDLLTSRPQSMTGLLGQALYNSSHELLLRLEILSMFCCAAQDNVTDTCQQMDPHSSRILNLTDLLAHSMQFGLFQMHRKPSQAT